MSSGDRGPPSRYVKSSMRNIEKHNGKAKEYIKDARDQLVSLSFES